jgi:hypothetical protein
MNSKTFKTTDIHLSAALKLHGFKLVTIEKDVSSKRGIFIFEDEPRRRQLVQDFFEGSLQGSLKKYISLWSDLKALINQMDPGYPDSSLNNRS